MKNEPVLINDPYLGGGLPPFSTGLGEPGGAITQYIFTTDDQIMLYLYHVLKGHKLVVGASKDQKNKITWITEEEDPTIKPIVTDKGLQYIMAFVRGNLSNISIVSTLPRRIIVERYADIRNDLAKELYVNYDIYFPTDNTEFLASAYHLAIRVVSDVLFFLLMGIENGRILDQLTKHVEEMHQFQHEQESKGFLGLKKGGGL